MNADMRMRARGICPLCQLDLRHHREDLGRCPTNSEVAAIVMMGREPMRPDGQRGISPSSVSDADVARLAAEARARAGSRSHPVSRLFGELADAVVSLGAERDAMRAREKSMEGNRHGD